MEKKNQAKNNDLRRRQIKKLMLDKDLSETQIARKLGTSPQMICDIIARRKETEKYQQGIAEILGVRVNKIFPKKKHQTMPGEARKISSPRIDASNRQGDPKIADSRI